MDGHDADKLLKPQVGDEGILFVRGEERLIERGQGWRLGVKKENRGSKALGKSPMILEETGRRS